jgi:ATP-dependent exoDNAse (exonuclease V) alpha subunit
MTQEQALEILKMGHNVYLTGSAGSGKTFLLNKYIRYLKKNGVEVAITASTGIAATHLGGMTIHSWSGLGIRDRLTENDYMMFLKKKQLIRRYLKTKVLIIDEVSMLHAFRLDLLNQLCQAFRQSLEPFGGMQVVLCGDFFQLPPVSRGGENADFVHKSEIWQKMNLKICYLSEQFRQSDDGLTKILNDIRGANLGEHILEPLRRRYDKPINSSAKPTKLYTHNVDVDAINHGELDNLRGKLSIYKMASRGNRRLAELLAQNCLAPVELRLKLGAAVMFVKNDHDGKYVNGTLGTIVGFDDNRFPVVRTLRGEEITAIPQSWTIEEDGKIRAEIIQIPLRLAWAITIHKSQGMTLDAAEMDLSKCFVEGMGYVALSRVRSLSGLKLMGLNDMALRVKEEVLGLDKNLIELSRLEVLELEKVNFQEKSEKQEEFIGETAEKSEPDISTYEKTKLLVLEKLSIGEIAKRRELKIGTITAHLEKIVCSEDRSIIKYLETSIPPDRLEKIKSAFNQSGDFRLSPVKEILGENYSYGEIRLARLFLIDNGNRDYFIKKESPKRAEGDCAAIGDGECRQ